MSGPCSWQVVINALAGLVVLVAPGFAALLLALSNRTALKGVPRRSTDKEAGGNGSSTT